MPGEWLKENEHWLVGLCTLGVLVLCYSAIKRGELSNPADELREGATASSLGFDASRTDTGAMDDSRSAVAGNLDAMMNFEPPVLWGPTSYSDVKKQQGGDIGFASDRSASALADRYSEGFKVNGVDVAPVWA